MYTDVRNVQILISLLKQFNIKYFVNSPGTRNTPLVHSIEEDPFFKCYSIVDERSAAYFALGLSEALDEPVCVTCTAATATCNYMPAIKEAYERNIQLVALTSDRESYPMFHMQDQSINQINMYAGYINYSVDIPAILNQEDEWFANRSINEALLEIKHKRKGPIQINYHVPSWGSFCVKNIPEERKITRYDNNNINWEEVKGRLKNKKILVFLGMNYNKEKENLKISIKKFYEKYNSAIAIDNYANINDNDFINASIFGDILTQKEVQELAPEIIITLGKVFYSPFKSRLNGKKQNFEHWHIDENGVVIDGFRNLTRIFECIPESFFDEVTKDVNTKNDYKYEQLLKNRISKIEVGKTPFSNFSVIKDFCKIIPKNSILHSSVLNSIRITNYFKIDDSIKCYANVGADGIDGAFSTFLGQANKTNEMAFLLIGDLSYLYDLNACLNVNNNLNYKNIRILIINNYAGAEFHKNFGLSMIPTLNLHIAAGHNTKMEETVGLENVIYLFAKNQQELNKAFEKFVEKSDKPIILEVFTNADCDAKTLKSFWNSNRKEKFYRKAVKKIMPRKYIVKLRKILKRG